jgi:hypothetical protein
VLVAANNDRRSLYLLSRLSVGGANLTNKLVKLHSIHRGLHPAAIVLKLAFSSHPAPEPLIDLQLSMCDRWTMQAR